MKPRRGWSQIVAVLCISVGAIGRVGTLAAQAPLATPTAPIVIRAARLIDPRTGTVMSDPVIVVRGGRITSVASNGAAPTGATVVDLANLTLMPGLIDAHTHLLQNDSGQLGGDDPNMLLTVTTMSTAKRALLGAKTGREDLEAGITTVRDVGNSGSAATSRSATRSTPGGWWASGSS